MFEKADTAQISPQDGRLGKCCAQLLVGPHQLQLDYTTT